jgi:hypothetical protein
MSQSAVSTDVMGTVWGTLAAVGADVRERGLL